MYISCMILGIYLLSQSYSEVEILEKELTIMQFIGIEAANSSTKVVSGDVVKNYDNRLKQLYRQELTIMNGKSDTVYTYSGQRYVLSDKGITSGGRNSKRYSTQEYLLQTLIGIAEVQKERDIVLVTGLPCSDYLSEQAIKSTVKTLKGNHEIMVGNKKHEIHIHEVFVIPQPLGTLIDFMFDDNLKIVNNRDKSKWLVIDIGRGTTDILLCEGMKAERIIGTDIGSMDITNLYLDCINDRFANTDYEFTRVDVGNNNNCIINKYEQTFDFSEELDMAKKEVSRQIMTFISDSGISFKMADRIIYTGGTSIALKDYLQINENAKIYKHAQTGNARG